MKLRPTWGAISALVTAMVGGNAFAAHISVKSTLSNMTDLTITVSAGTLSLPFDSVEVTTGLNTVLNSPGHGEPSGWTFSGGSGNPIQGNDFTWTTPVNTRGSFQFSLSSASYLADPLHPITIDIDYLGPGGKSYFYGGDVYVDSNGKTTYSKPAQVVVVPEPATWAAILLGLGMTGAGLRRTRSKVSACRLA